MSCHPRPNRILPVFLFFLHPKESSAVYLKYLQVICNFLYFPAFKSPSSFLKQGAEVVGGRLSGRETGEAGMTAEEVKITGKGTRSLKLLGIGLTLIEGKVHVTFVSPNVAGKDVAMGWLRLVGSLKL